MNKSDLKNPVTTMETAQAGSAGAPDEEAIRRRAATLIKSGWLDEGLEALASLIGTPGADNPAFRLQLGKALLAAGRFEEAETITIEGPLVWPGEKTEPKESEPEETEGRQ
jgi:Flp pilus assembly protein TadD